jgi:hypothetical protein
MLSHSTAGRWDEKHWDVTTHRNSSIYVIMSYLSRQSTDVYSTIASCNQKQKKNHRWYSKTNVNQVRPTFANLKRSRLLVKNNYTFTINYKQLSLCRYYGVRVEHRYNSIHLTLPLNESNQIHAPSALPLEKNTPVSIQQGTGWTHSCSGKTKISYPCRDSKLGTA